MVLIAASFSLRLARLGVSDASSSGSLAGFGLYFLSALTHALGETGILPCLSRGRARRGGYPFGMTLVFHQEDG